MKRIIRLSITLVTSISLIVQAFSGIENLEFLTGDVTVAEYTNESGDLTSGGILLGNTILGSGVLINGDILSGDIDGNSGNTVTGDAIGGNISVNETIMEALSGEIAGNSGNTVTGDAIGGNISVNETIMEALSGEIAGNSGNTVTGDAIGGNISVNETIMEALSGEIAGNSGNTVTGDLTGNSWISNNTLAILYIPEQEAIVMPLDNSEINDIENMILWEEMNIISSGNAGDTVNTVDINPNNDEEAGSDGGIGKEGDGSGKILIYVADIQYSTKENNTAVGKCDKLQYCLIVEDNDGLLGRYINIDQTVMSGNANNILDDNALFMDTSNSSIIYLSLQRSPNVRVIPSNGFVNFDNDAGHTILSKERIDGIHGSYAVNPDFLASTQQLPQSSYTGSTVITLYQY